MLDVIRQVLKNGIKAIYQPFLFVMFFSILIMFFIMYLEKYKDDCIKKKIIKAFKEWKEKFIRSVKFRRTFYLAFSITLMLFKTMINRDMWINSVIDVIGIWGFHKKDGTFTTENIENALLFCIFICSLLLYIDVKKKKMNSIFQSLWKGALYAFIVSFLLEGLQLFLHTDFWQLSDIFYGTVGGIVGGFFYWVHIKLTKKRK